MRKGRNLDKIRLIDEYYNILITYDYLYELRKKTGLIGAVSLIVAHETYLNYRDNKFLDGVLGGKIDLGHIDLFSDVMLEITKYLDIYKLTPNTD